jgi:hypothetical protein
MQSEVILGAMTTVLMKILPSLAMKSVEGEANRTNGRHVE